MKKTLIFIAIIFLSVFSCVNTSNEKADSTNEELKGKNACDEFLAHYEKWADKYFQAIEDYMNNPSDEEIAARYMELMQQAMEWSNEWVDLVECADEEEYKQQFEKISSEIEQKMQELNL
jgi:hypothetical protein